MLNGIRLDPNASESSAGGSPTPEVKTPTEIEIGGNKYTPEQITAKLKESEDAASDNRTLFDPTKSESEREGAARRHLSRLGYKKDQIDSWVATNITGEAEVTEEVKPPVSQGDNTEVADLKKQVNKLRGANLNSAFKNALDKTLLESSEIKSLLNAATRLRGEKEVPKVRDRIAESLKREALRRIDLRVRTTGEEVSEEWLADEVSQAVKEVVEQHSAVIGDPSSVGRSTETSTSTNPFANRKKAPPPVVDGKKSLGEVESDALAWMTDGLSEWASQVPSKGESKV